MPSRLLKRTPQETGSRDHYSSRRPSTASFTVVTSWPRLQGLRMSESLSTSPRYTSTHPQGDAPFNLDYDLELLSHLDDPEAWKVLRDEGFSTRLIRDDDVREVYRFAEKHLHDEGQPPSSEVLIDQFDWLELDEPVTAIGDLIHRFRVQYMNNEGRDGLKAIGKQYEKDPMQVIPKMREYLRTYDDRVSPNGTINAADIPLERLRWGWDNWMPVGYLALVTGVSSIGKSIFACWLISALTRGRLDGEFKGEPTKVLLVANEDGLADMWGPRLTAAGADLECVEYLKYPDEWNIRDGMALIDREVERHDAKLVYIDCTLEHLPAAKGGESTYNPSFVRSSLKPLKAMCKDRKVAGVVSLHPPKAKGSSFSDWVAGSAAWVQSTRTGLLFGEHPEDHALLPQERRRVITSPAESRNVGEDVGSLEFEIKTKPLEIEGQTTSQPYITEPVTCGVTFDELMKPPYDDEPRQSKDAEIKALIDAGLEDGKWHPAMNELLESGGYNPSTIKTAAKGYVEKRKGKTCWWWAEKGTSPDSFQEVEVPDTLPN